MMVPKSITVLVDSREKFPFLFPKTLEWFPQRSMRGSSLITVKTARTKMEAGDYALEGYEHLCCIERKASLSELSQNLLSSDYARAHAALVRFAKSCKFPYIVLDTDPHALFMDAYLYSKASPELVIDAFFTEVTGLGVPVFCTGRVRNPTQRRNVGLFLTHMMLTHALVTNGDPHKILQDWGVDLPEHPTYDEAVITKGAQDGEAENESQKETSTDDPGSGRKSPRTNRRRGNRYSSRATSIEARR